MHTFTVGVFFFFVMPYCFRRILLMITVNKHEFSDVKISYIYFLSFSLVVWHFNQFLFSLKLTWCVFFSLQYFVVVVVVIFVARIDKWVTAMWRRYTALVKKSVWNKFSTVYELISMKNNGDCMPQRERETGADEKSSENKKIPSFSNVHRQTKKKANWYNLVRIFFFSSMSLSFATDLCPISCVHIIICCVFSELSRTRVGTEKKARSFFVSFKQHDDVDATITAADRHCHRLCFYCLI